MPVLPISFCLLCSQGFQGLHLGFLCGYWNSGYSGANAQGNKHLAEASAYGQEMM
jgi:hypothetical protein